MSDRHALGELQDIQRHLRSLDGTVRVLASTDRPAIRRQIEETFADPRMVIVFRGVQRGLNQTETAKELELRDFTGAHQSFVSIARAKLQERDFIDKAAEGGGYVIVEGWKAFNLEKTLRRILKAAGIDDLA